MSKKILKLQSGFAHLHLLILIALVIAAISFVGGYVYNAQKKRNDAANQTAASNQDKPKEKIEVKTDDSSEKTTVAVSELVKEAEPVKKETTTTTTKKKTEPTYTYVTISSTTADVGAENVVFTATLPGTYTGYCKTMVKLEDGSNEQWFDTSFGPANTCNVTVSRSKLTVGTTWKYYMYLKTSDGLTKGESAYSTFTLN